jgi:hypothetical protein
MPLNSHSETLLCGLIADGWKIRAAVLRYIRQGDIACINANF